MTSPPPPLPLKSQIWKVGFPEVAGDFRLPLLLASVDPDICFRLVNVLKRLPRGEFRTHVRALENRLAR